MATRLSARLVSLCFAFDPTGLHAQAGLESYDLAPYRVMSVHGDWRVICTPEGTGSWTRPRDCAVEDRHGLVVFVNGFGYFAYTMRGHGPGDGTGLGDFADEPHGGVILTYAGPDTSAEFLQSAGFLRGGAPYDVSLEGYAEAQAAAIDLME
jgi:hypothetical protein